MNTISIKPSVGRKIVLRPGSMNRRQPLLVNQPSSGGSRFAEVAGGTAAECAAICCCCPCGLVNLFICAVYKLPAGLCRRALRRKRRERLIKKGLLPPQRRRKCQCGCDDVEFHIRPVTAEELTEMESAKWDCESEKEVAELEKEMWERFYGTGFWRSPSQREPLPA